MPCEFFNHAWYSPAGIPNSRLRSRRSTAG